MNSAGLPRVEYDETVDAGYIHCYDDATSFERTVEVAPGVNVDFGEEGVVLGIEVLVTTPEFVRFAKKFEQ